MNKVLIGTIAAGALAALVGVSAAQGPGSGGGPGWGGGQGWGMGPGMMGRSSGMGPGMMGYGGGPGFGCGRFAGSGGGRGAAAAAQITPDKAKELAQDYTKEYLPGFTVERVLPVQRRFATMYQAELKGPAGEQRLLHVNPWGNVMPFGGPVTR